MKSSGALIGRPRTAHPRTEDAALPAVPGLVSAPERDEPCAVRCRGRSSGHRRTGALRHHPRPSRQPRLPPLLSLTSVPLPPHFWFVFVCLYFSHLLRTSSAAAAPREPRSAPGHPRAPPPHASASGRLQKAQPLARLPVPPGPSRRTPAVLPSGRGLPSARGAVRTCPGRTQAAPALRDAAPGSVGRGRAAAGR